MNWAFSILLIALAGCASITPMSEATPEQIEQISYLRERSTDIKNAGSMNEKYRSISNATMLGTK